MSIANDTATKFVAITPSDTVSLVDPCKAIYVGVTGNITCLNNNGEAILFVAAQAGSTIRISTSRVNATATTATNLIALSN